MYLVTSWRTAKIKTWNLTSGWPVTFSPFRALLPWTALQCNDELRAGSISSSAAASGFSAFCTGMLSNDALKTWAKYPQQWTPISRKDSTDPNFVHFPGAGTSGCDESMTCSNVEPEGSRHNWHNATTFQNMWLHPQSITHTHNTYCHIVLYLGLESDIILTYNTLCICCLSVCCFASLTLEKYLTKSTATYHIILSKLAA